MIGAILLLEGSMAVLVHDIPSLVVCTVLAWLVHDCILGEMGGLLTVTTLALHHICSIGLPLFDGGLGTLPRMALLGLRLVPCGDYLVL